LFRSFPHVVATGLYRTGAVGLTVPGTGGGIAAIACFSTFAHTVAAHRAGGRCGGARHQEPIAVSAAVENQMIRVRPAGETEHDID
jgi:hypothetical protein